MSASKAWPGAQLWRNDEEMAKKDDDHRLAPKRPSAQWNAARAPRPAWVFRLVAYTVVAVTFVFFLLHATGFDGASDRPPSSRGHYVPGMSSSRSDYTYPRQQAPRPPSRKPPQAVVAHPHDSPRGAGADRRRDYNEPLTQPELTESLRKVNAVSPGSNRNRNVLFAAASLQSAATLLPMACQMASERQNQLHFMFVGRRDVPLKELLKINGIDSTCPLMMHGVHAHSRSMLCSC